jgi:hypothetical protein
VKSSVDKPSCEKSVDGSVRIAFPYELFIRKLILIIRSKKMLSVDDKILSSIEIGCSRPYVNDIIEEWLKPEWKTSARHCMEAFLTCVVVHELRLKEVQAKIDKLGVRGRKRCDFRIDKTEYKVEIKKSLTGETDLVKEIEKKTKGYAACNPFLLIYISVKERWINNVTNLEGRIKSILGSEWGLSRRIDLPHGGFAVLVKKLNQAPYSNSSN